MIQSGIFTDIFKKIQFWITFKSKKVKVLQKDKI